MLTATCHSEETGWTEIADIDTVSELRREDHNVLWAESDVRKLEEREVATIADEFGLNSMAVEDAMHARQRPKLESYPNHLFVVVHQLDEEGGQSEASQIASFLGDRYLLAIHDGADRLLQQARDRLRKVTANELNLGPGFLLYVLLDTVVDDYQGHADRLEAELEDLEEIVLGAPGAPVQRQLYHLKQRLSRLRRFALPIERVLDRVTGPGERLFSEGTDDMFRDVHDHVIRITEQIRSIDDLTDAVLDLTRAAQADSLNQVTKRLTGWAAIIAVPTLIAGVYGMNFQLLPEENSLYGFLFAVLVMSAISGILYFYFKRKDWI